VQRVSVVIAARNEATALPHLIDEVFDALAAEPVDVTIFVIDDGSTDDTSAIVLQHRRSDERIHLIRLSRNFGHQAALLAGLRAADGDAIVCLDGDGQHPPTLIPKLLSRWREGADVVNTIRSDPDGTHIAKRWTARLFYRLFRALSGLPLHHGMADFRLLSRRALDATLLAAGSRPFFRGTSVWIGFNQAVEPYEARERMGGSTSYSWRAMTALARDGVVGFSARPIWIISCLGVTASALAFLVAAYAIAVGIVSSNAVPGWASTVGFLAILQGLTFALLGMFGVYLGAVFAEVLDRPTYIVADVDEWDDQETRDSCLQKTDTRATAPPPPRIDAIQKPVHSQRSRKSVNVIVDEPFPGAEYDTN
jgi:dolichol-phosphate mannosyltransferase